MIGTGAGAEQEYQRAIQLNPNYGTPHHGYAYLFDFRRRTEAAIAEIKKAEEIDPLSLIFSDRSRRVLLFCAAA